MAYYDFSKLEDIRTAMGQLKQQVIHPDGAISLLAAAIEKLAEEIEQLKSRAA